MGGRYGFSMLMKKASLVGAFFVPGIWLSAAHAEAYCPAPTSLAHVEVQHVVDGDTVRLKDGRRVRMIGLNTPETGKKGRTDEPLAVAARQRLQALVMASDGRLGLWRQSPVQSAAQLTRSGFALVSGRVSKIERNRGGIWIELQGALVLRIAPDQVQQFDSALLTGLQGRVIEARGWVQDRSTRGAVKSSQVRWLLPLTDPSMFKSTL